VHEVITVALESRVVLQSDEHVEVTGRPATHPGLALARDAQLLAIVDSRRDGERDVPVLALAALAATPRAYLVDGLAGAAAARAGRHVHEATEHRLLDLAHLATPVALLARGDGRARLRAVAAAALARLEARDLDPAIAPAHGVDELDLELHPKIGATHRPALAAARLAAEERVEQVVDAEADGAIGAPEHVVPLAALRVREDLVRLGHFAEAERCLLGLIHVRVVLARELPVRAADLVFRRFARDPKDGVVIGAGHQLIIGAGRG